MTTMITADQAARALIGACIEFGVDPLRVFEPGFAYVRERAAIRLEAFDVLRRPVLNRVLQLPNPVREPAGASA